MMVIKGIMFGVVIMALCYWLTHRAWLEGEIRRNDMVDPPSDRQFRWDIRHMREDLHMLVLINYALLFIIILIILFNFW